MSRKYTQEPGAPGRLVFAGDVYCDLVFVGADVPQPGGETFADQFLIAPGGVANRSVAAARSGAATSIVSALGDDPLGKYVRLLLESEKGLEGAGRQPAALGARISESGERGAERAA